MRRRAFLLAMAPLTDCHSSSSAGFPGFAFIANEESRSIASVDLMKFRVAREVALDGNPTALISHARRAAIYALTPQTGTVHEIDPVSLRVVRKARLGTPVVSMRLSADGESLWILGRESRTLIQLRLAGLQPGARIKVPGIPENFDVSQARAAVSLPAEGSLAVINLRQSQVEKVVETGPDVRTVRFHAEGRRILCGNRGNRTLTFYDIASSRIVAHLPLAVEPVNFCYKASNDGEMYVSGAGMDAIVVVYPYQTEIRETRLIGRSPGAMAASLSPEYLFVANTESGNVTVMDVVTGKILAKVAVGVEPRSIVVTDDSQYALVLNSRSGDLAVLDITAFASAKRARTAPAPLFTMIPVGSGPVSVVIRRV